MTQRLRPCHRACILGCLGAVAVLLSACEQRVVAARGLGAQGTPRSVSPADGPRDSIVFTERQMQERKSSMRPVTRAPRPAGSTPANSTDRPPVRSTDRSSDR